MYIVIEHFYFTLKMMETLLEIDLWYYGDEEQDQNDLQEPKQKTLMIFDRHFKHSWKLFKYS